MNDEIKEKVRELFQQNAKLKSQVIELKCLVLEREKILSSIQEYVDDEDITVDTDASWIAEVVLEKVRCRTEIKFSVADMDITPAPKDDESLIEKRLKNIGKE